jgi:hypothetical protein
MEVSKRIPWPGKDCNVLVSLQACPLRLGRALTFDAEHPYHERSQRLSRLKVGGLSRDHVLHPPCQVSCLDCRIRPKLHDKGAGNRQGVGRSVRGTMLYSWGQGCTGIGPGFWG